MKKSFLFLKEKDGCGHWSYSDLHFAIKPSEGVSIENFKRRRMLHPVTPLDARSRLFFERVLSVKKTREFVFVSKARAKNR